MDNQPPRILPGSLTPRPEDLPRFMSTQCSEYRFFASVQDPDPGDTIYWRVFIDYANDPAPHTRARVTSEEPDPSSPGAPRPITFAVLPRDDRFGVGDFAVPHTVELLIGDRLFEDERAPSGRVVADEGLTATFAWNIELSDAADPGGCL